MDSPKIMENLYNNNIKYLGRWNICNYHVSKTVYFIKIYKYY